ncbi:methyltransferase domain-containing protein (plasmid) [Cereibacter azotoformans]|uniref:class I SAM-dependent methyltransferase n=1 Tax=Cereibacter azotoformans TaxID=43057 RepID=UPI001EEB75E7|nr:methyltransferase domain-containing protein [Cereibacter azotoformans]ULB12463.1 methyltransferase domain-containing protein [Cereibacter azotoformans]
MLTEAAALDHEAGVNVVYRVALAEELPVASESVQLVTAGQCWHWLDRAAAAREASRVLAPGDRIVIAHFDWLPLAGNVVEATEELILMHNPSWTMAGGNGIYPGWLRDLAETSFVGLETFFFDIAVSYSQEAWRGRIRPSAGVKARLGTAAIEYCQRSYASAFPEKAPIQR